MLESKKIVQFSYFGAKVPTYFEKLQVPAFFQKEYGQSNDARPVASEHFCLPSAPYKIVKYKLKPASNPRLVALEPFCLIYWVK